MDTNIDEDKKFAEWVTEDIKKWGVDELKSLLSKLKLKASGTKHELAHRLLPFQNSDNDLLEKQIKEINKSFKFKTSMDKTPPPSGEWLLDGSFYPKLRCNNVFKLRAVLEDRSFSMKSETCDQAVLRPRVSVMSNDVWHSYVVIDDKKLTEQKDASQLKESHTNAKSDLLFVNEKNAMKELLEIVHNAEGEMKILSLPKYTNKPEPYGCNYVKVDQRSSEWQSLRVVVISASKLPYLLGFHVQKEFIRSWFFIHNNIDESLAAPKTFKNFARGHQFEGNAIELFKELSGVMEGLQFCLHRSAPGVLRPSSFLFPLRCPVEGRAGDVVLLPPHNMSNPSPSPLHDDGPHAVLVASCEKFLVGDGLRPEDAEDSSEVLGVEVDGQVGEQRQHTTTLSHTGLHIEADVAASYLAGEVVVEALNDENDFLRYSERPDDSPQALSVDKG
ncbi:hypothetical protein AWC38_SpisGene16220 [Stylophora pistillata]|uniref:SAP domain-containing protein n=1 Tax=Stylophora pistillata TaxID=50429 RepID=A0A2B4RP36_STYPI|nr:hypothetical protein AWC38_SpisGene16220 [Stylophora pistillata]